MDVGRGREIFKEKDQVLDISVIIPTLNRDLYLKNTLGDLRRQEGNFSWEIIVVDQNPVPIQGRDKAFYSETEKAGGVRWVVSPGHAVVLARNQGVGMAKGEILVFVDDDVEIKDPHFLSKHLKAHIESGSEVAAVCGREVNAGSGEFVHRLHYRREGPLSDVLHFPRNFSQKMEAVVLSTCNCSIKKKPLCDVEGFDENFGGASYGDDSDLALRLAAAGYKILYDPGPVLHHLRAPVGGLRLSTTNKGSSFSDRDKVLSSLVFYRKHVRNQRWGIKLFYIRNHILRRSIFLKANVVRPWKLVGAVVGLVQACLAVRRCPGRGSVSTASR